MTETLLDPVSWFRAALLLAAGGIAALIALAQTAGSPRHRLIPAALHLLYGCVIGMLGTGHMVAIAINRAQGTASPDLNWWLVYPLGFVIAVSGLLLIGSAFWHTRAWPRAVFAAVDIWIVLLLFIVLPIGPNAPLAIPAAINLVSLLPKVRETLVLASSGFVYAAMLVASFFVTF